MHQDGFLTTEEAAEFLGCSRSKLQKDRTHGQGPAFYKHGRLVVYRVKDLVAFMENSKHTSTSQYSDRRIA
jgi:excisionase family DNA binding protein